MAFYDSALPKLREQLTLNQWATGSIPVRPTNEINDLDTPPSLSLFVGARLVLG